MNLERAFGLEGAAQVACRGFVFVDQEYREYFVRLHSPAVIGKDRSQERAHAATSIIDIDLRQLVAFCPRLEIHQNCAMFARFVN